VQQKNINYEIKITFWNIPFWHVLKTQHISLLTKHIKGISMGAFLCASSIYYTSRIEVISCLRVSIENFITEKCLHTVKVTGI
jgi:hypothetical protein